MFRYFVCLCAFVLLPANAAFAGNFHPPSSTWKTTVENGVHWLVSPESKLFYSKGVNIVTGWPETPQSRVKQAYCWNNFYHSQAEWRADAARRLTEWGFNTRGGWSDPSPDLGLALTVDLELGRNSQFHWFDPFDPAMEEKTYRKALELTAPYRGDPRLIGYFSDNEVGWWNAPLFQWYLKAGWENHTKRELLRLIHEYYGGEWKRFLDDWVPQGPVEGFEGLKQAGVKVKLRPGGNGIRLVDRFMGLVARRYYELMGKAIRKAHPGALVLGDRLPLYYHQDAALAIGDSVDVVSTNYNVDVADGWVAPYFFEGLARLTDKPVLVTEFFFAAEENRSGNRNETARNPHAKAGHLMTVETQIARAWGAGNALLNFARFPNVVGAHWFQFCDEPLGGREDGEDYNMGLIDTANRPYEDVTDAFKKLNPVLDGYHKLGGLTASSTPGAPANERKAEVPIAADMPVSIVRATSPIDVGDQSLIDWEKESTLLKGFKTKSPYVPFGDAHVAWTPEGLYLATIANTYVDPGFLDYDGEFPESESFQLHIHTEFEGKARGFSVYLVPQTNPAFPDGFEVTPRLYRGVGDCPGERVPAEAFVQKMEKSLPHMVIEAFIPAEWIGADRLSVGKELRMNIVMTGYYREFTMTWAGVPGPNGGENTKYFRKVVLKDNVREAKSAGGPP